MVRLGGGSRILLPALMDAKLADRQPVPLRGFRLMMSIKPIHQSVERFHSAILDTYSSFPSPFSPGEVPTVPLEKVSTKTC
jgi:hypothetical protein